MQKRMEHRISESRINYSRQNNARGDTNPVVSIGSPSSSSTNPSPTSSASTSSSPTPPNQRKKKTNPFITKYFIESFAPDGTPMHICKYQNCERKFKVSTSITNKRRHINSHNIARTEWSKQSLQEKRKILVKFIATSASPYALVENHWFRIMTGLNISSKKVSKLVIDTYKNEMVMLSQRLNTVDEICITTDIWTASNKKAYATYTAHIYIKGKIESYTIHFVRMKGSHNGSKLQEELEKVLWTFGLQQKIFAVTCDDASNNKAAISLLNSARNYQNQHSIKRISCFCRMIHNVVTYVMEENTFNPMITVARKISSTIHKSCRLRESLSNECNNQGCRNVSVITDCKTRWNSCYLMLSRLIELRGPIRTLFYEEPILFDHILTSDQWQQAINLVKFLEPFHKATIDLSDASTFNFSHVYPQFESLVEHCEQTIARSNLDRHHFASPALFKLNVYKEKVINDVSLMATFLDPYLKCNLKTNDENRLKGQLRTEISSNSTIAESEPNEAANRIGSHSTRASLRVERNQSSQLLDELESYSAEDVRSHNVDIALWWFNKRFTYPNLFKIAKKYIVTRPSSVPSESSFSIASWFTPPKRNRLSDDSTQSNLVLHSIFTKELRADDEPADEQSEPDDPIVIED